MREVCSKLFKLPHEELAKYMSSDMHATVRYGTSDNQTKDKVFSWRDFLKLTCNPNLHHLLSAAFKDSASTYAQQTRRLFMNLAKAIFCFRVFIPSFSKSIPLIQCPPTKRSYPLESFSLQDMFNTLKQDKNMSARYHVGVCSFHLLLFTALISVLLQSVEMNAIAVPSSSCYVFDNSSHIIDFSTWIGHPFEYDGKDSDLVVRFCKDVEGRSQTGYVDFGRFDKFNYFVSGSGHTNFVQGYYNGDLTSCEQSYDKLGRTAQVNVICGDCLNGKCKGVLGCICNVTYESSCRVIVDLAIPCEKQGPRVFKGCTVGFHPRSWEIVYNGLTQLGYEKPHRAFSFSTEQTGVVLYMTAIASLSSLVQKPIIQVFPENGLEVTVSGSGATGNYPTTLSPSMLMIDWRCDIARVIPYEVNVTIPVVDYEPISFFLTKTCEKRQDVQGDSMKGWATFGILSCIFVVGASLFCCGGFVYKAQLQGQRGIDALPGMALLSACLETVSGAGQSYPRAEGVNNAFVSEASGNRPPSSSSSRQTWTPSEKNYGSI